jgi:hypothetical protein
MTEETNERRRPCLRCLIADLPDEKALAGIIRERIAQLPLEEKVTEEERQRRLNLCRLCRHLNHGTCALCGCYVEIRSARKALGCPDVPGKW